MFIYRQLPTKIVELREDGFGQEAYMEGFLIENIHLLAPGEDNKAEPIGRQIVWGKSGRIDLLALVLEDKKPKLKIIEIKNVPAGKKEIEQLKKYLQAWKEEGLSLVKEQDIRNNFDNTMKKWGKDIKDLAVEGVLVAPKFNPAVIKEILEPQNNIYGIQMSKYSSDDSDLKETFIFLQYYPESKSKPISITAEEFWEGRSADKRKTVEGIIETAKESESEITHKYWKAMISIYPTPTEAGKNKPYRIARYIQGDKCFRVGVSQDTKKIDLSHKDEIIKEILKAKQQYHQM